MTTSTASTMTTTATATGHAPQEEGRTLARWARARLRQALGGTPAHRPDLPLGGRPGASFVTLRWRNGDLQGCVGSLEPDRLLVDDVGHNAIAAGTRDPRALPIRLEDVDLLDLELSILSPLEEVRVSSEEEALGALADWAHGVVIAWRNRRATFLPVMWETFEEPEALLHALKRKAGLAADFWHDEMRLWRYTVETFVDPAPGTLP